MGDEGGSAGSFLRLGGMAAGSVGSACAVGGAGVAGLAGGLAARFEEGATGDGVGGCRLGKEFGQEVEECVAKALPRAVGAHFGAGKQAAVGLVTEEVVDDGLEGCVHVAAADVPVLFELEVDIEGQPDLSPVGVMLAEGEGLGHADDQVADLYAVNGHRVGEGVDRVDGAHERVGIVCAGRPGSRDVVDRQELGEDGGDVGSARYFAVRALAFRIFAGRLADPGGGSAGNKLGDGRGGAARADGIED